MSNKRGQPKTFTEQEFKDFVFEYMDFTDLLERKKNVLITQYADVLTNTGQI